MKRSVTVVGKRDGYIVPVKVSYVRPTPQAKLWRAMQGKAKLNGSPNWRDHSACAHKAQGVETMQVAEIKVGSRNRDKTASVVEFMFDWAEILIEDGDFYDGMISHGLRLESGEDYRIVDAEGNPVTLKREPEKVAKAIKVIVASTLNCPTSAKLPEAGPHISASSRSWVSFRPRIDTLFEDDNALAEYVETNS